MSTVQQLDGLIGKRVAVTNMAFHEEATYTRFRVWGRLKVTWQGDVRLYGIRLLGRRIEFPVAAVVSITNDSQARPTITLK